MNYKGYIISADAVSPNLYRVATEGRGGKIPNTLQGCFTHLEVVTSLIDGHLEAQEVKGERKTNTKG